MQQFSASWLHSASSRGLCFWLLTSNKTFSATLWVKDATPDPTKCWQHAQFFTFFFPLTTGTSVPYLHPLSHQALCPQRCHDPRQGHGFNHVSPIKETSLQLENCRIPGSHPFSGTLGSGLYLLCFFPQKRARSAGAGNVNAGSNLTLLILVLVKG